MGLEPGFLERSTQSMDAFIERGCCDFIVEFAGHKIPLLNAYSDATPGRALALFNGFGLLEVAIRNGKVAEELDWQRGSPVSIRVVRNSE